MENDNEAISGARSGFGRLAELLTSGTPLSPAAIVAEGATRSAAEALLKLSVAEERDGVFALLPPFDLPLLRLFGPLLDRLQPVFMETTGHDAVRDNPLKQIAALVNRPTFGFEDLRSGKPDRFAVGGQGQTASAAFVACIGEMAERISQFPAGNEDPRFVEPDPALIDFDPGPYLGFSAEQEREMALRLTDNFLDPTLEKGSARPDWRSFSNQRLQVQGYEGERGVGQISPVGQLMGYRSPADAIGIGLASTSGAAVWSDFQTAKRQALQEAVERDAIARAWYNRVGITGLEEGFWGEVIPRNLRDFFSSRPKKTVLCRIACEFDLYVVAALSVDPDGFGGAFGAGAGATLAEAARAAAGELLQCETSISLARRSFGIGDAGARPAMKRQASRQLPSLLKYGLENRLFEDLDLAACEVEQWSDGPCAFDRDGLAESCLRRGIDLKLIDLTLPDLGIPCAKVLSRDLCDWRPRFGRARLFPNHTEAERLVVEARFRARSFPF